GREDMRVIRELAVDQLGDELDGAEGERSLARRELDIYLFFAIREELGELEHRFSRDDDFLAWQFSRKLEGSVGEPVPVGRDELQLLFLHDHQQAVQVVANIL